VAVGRHPLYSLSYCVDLPTADVGLCVCVCVREREREMYLNVNLEVPATVRS